MKREEIRGKVEQIFRRVTGNEELVISEKTIIGGSIGDDILQISSIDFVQAIVEIEDCFNIIIDFDLPLNSVSDLIAIIDNGRQEQL